MKCPWCKNELNKVMLTPKARPNEQPHESWHCATCVVTGTPEWWKARAKDMQSLPPGDR